MRFHGILLALTLAALATACSHEQSQQSEGSSPAVSPPAVVTATPRVTRSASPTAKPMPAATATPAPVTAVPSPAPTPATKIPRLPPDAPPQILSIDVDKTTVTSGDRVSGTVLTTSNVASVEVRVAGYGVSLNKIGVGRFSLVYTLGNLPFFVRGTYAMQVIARNARGNATQRSIAIVVR